MDDKPAYDELVQKVKKLEDEIATLKGLKKHWHILSSAIDDSSEGIVIIDLKGNVNYLNNTFAELHGYSVNDLLGKHFSIFHTPQQMPSVQAANRQVKDKGTFIGEIWHTRRDGTAFPAIMHNSLIRDEEGKPVYWLGTLRDISEQKNLERELLESGNKYRSLFEGSLSPIIVFDRDGIVIMINSAGAGSLGQSVDACIGKSITELLPDHDEVYLSIIQEVVHTGVKMTREDLVELPSGPRWFWSVLEPVSNIHGKQYGVQVISYDITKRKQAENEMQENRQRLKDFINSATDSFVLFDSELNIIQVNKAHMEMFHPGMDQEELIGKNLVEIVPNLKETGRFDDFMKVMETGTPFYADDIIPHKKFGKRNLSVKAFKMAGGLGTITVDVTELKQGEKRQQFQKDLLERLSKTTSLAETLKKILSTIFQLDEFDSGGIYLFDEKTGGLNLIEHQGLPQMFVEKVKYYDPDDTRLQIIMKGDPCYQKVFELPASIREDLELDGITALSVIPIKFKGKVMGAINLASHTHDVITEYSMNVLEMISDMDIGASISRVVAEEGIKKAKEELEGKVIERTAELEEKNTTLKVLLDQRKDDKKKLEKAIMSNVKELLMPNVSRLKNSELSSKQKTELNVLESNLNEIVLPLAGKLPSSYLKLTSTEIQVANFIKHGATSKEIADSLGLSRRTIDTHRYNIRRKIGISGKGINLRTYLSSN
jgi:PAS domain S-box-containing protein